MATEKNYYRILEIPTQATDEQIKLAYRRLVKKWHPDLNNNSLESQEKLKEVNEAYEILSDPTARTIYNQTIAANMAASSSERVKTETEKRQEQEQKARQDRVKNRYEKRKTEAKVYYTEFERILEQYKNDRCDAGFFDKLNILFSDMKTQPGLIRAYAAPMLVFAAIFWHGCDLVSRGIEYVIKAFTTSTN